MVQLHEQTVDNAEHVIELVQQGAAPAEIIASQQAVAAHEHDAKVSTIQVAVLGLAALSGLATGDAWRRKRQPNTLE
jgi:hypothetical protein